MYKGKICSFAIACLVGIAAFNPIDTLAAETKQETVTQTAECKKERAAFEEKMKKAEAKWDTLTAKQKEEVYTLMDEELETENKIMDKLAQLGVLEKEDASMVKNFMADRYKKVKDSGEFPFYRQGGRRNRK